MTKTWGRVKVEVSVGVGDGGAGDSLAASDGVVVAAGGAAQDIATVAMTSASAKRARIDMTILAA